MDSGCSRHMTGDKTQFSSLKSKDRGHVTFGDNGKGKIIGIGKIGKESTTLLIKFYLCMDLSIIS
jgi:hypothetical protein